ncbi:hypothetical protein ACJJTC_012901 [Scirpophaga incertulas]
MNRVILKIITITISSPLMSCTISGISYMDGFPQRPLPDSYLDPCNQLYWYPKPIPDYCYRNVLPSSPNQNIKKNPPLPPENSVKIPPQSGVIPLPVPVPVPLPQMIPIAPIPQPPFVANLPPVGLPLPPNLPITGVAYPQNPYLGQQIGMVPGIPGLVSKHGGVNIMPFSDIYSDMLDKFKNKMMRKRLHKVLNDYEDYPRYSLNRHYKKNRYY